MVFTFQYGRRSLKKEKMKMHLKKGFSKQVSFKASQSSTSYPLVKTGINVLCRKKIYISRQLCSFATVLLLESHPWHSTGQCVSESSSTAAARTFLLTQLQSYLLLFFSVLSWCYCFYLLLKNYSLIIFQSACLPFFFFSFDCIIKGSNI